MTLRMVVPCLPTPTMIDMFVLCSYLYIRGLHDRQGVLSARLAVLDHIKQAGPDKLDTRYPWQQGILDSRCGHNCIPFMEVTLT